MRAGALKGGKDERTKANRVVVADAAKLKEVVSQERDRLTPALCDAMLRAYSHPGVVTLLLEIAEAKEDLRLKAFGLLFQGRLREGEEKGIPSRLAYEGAAKLFAELKMRECQASCLDNLAMICKAQVDLPQAHKLCQQALDLRKDLDGERHPIPRSWNSGSLFELHWLLC